MRQVLQRATGSYYKLRQVLKSASGITKCDRLLLQSAAGITNSDCYYSVRRNTYMNLLNVEFLSIKY